MIVTAHQPNFLPGLSVTEKIRAADAVIWLDEVQYEKGGFTNRNRMPDGSWLTVPIARETDGGPVNRVEITEHGHWRDRAAKTLRHHYGVNANRYVEHLQRPYRLLVALNLACLRILLHGNQTEWHFQSHLDGGRVIPAVTDDAEELKAISLRLATMVHEIGGTVYLSGPSGRKYLSHKPFHELGIEVAYFEWKERENPCSISRPYRFTIASTGPAEAAA